MNDRIASVVSELEDEVYGLQCGMGVLEEENAKLRGFWTHDGTWHVELPKLPDVIMVRLPDERDREVRSAKVWKYVKEEA